MVQDSAMLSVKITMVLNFFGHLHGNLMEGFSIKPSPKEFRPPLAKINPDALDIVPLM